MYTPPAYTYTPYILYVYTNLIYVVNAIPSPVSNATRYTVHVSDGANPWVRSTLYSLAALDSGTGVNFYSYMRVIYSLSIYVCVCVCGTFFATFFVCVCCVFMYVSCLLTQIKTIFA